MRGRRESALVVDPVMNARGEEQGLWRGRHKGDGGPVSYLVRSYALIDAMGDAYVHGRAEAGVGASPPPPQRAAEPRAACVARG